MTSVVAGLVNSRTDELAVGKWPGTIESQQAWGEWRQVHAGVETVVVKSGAKIPAVPRIVSPR
jgi:hypothetical protein